MKRGSLRRNKGPRKIPLEDITQALSFIDAEPRDVWLKAGMALKDEYGDRAYDTWNRWASKSTKFNLKDSESCWRSLNGEGITIATLLYLAKDNGYRAAGQKRKQITQSPSPPSTANTNLYSDQYARNLWDSANQEEENVIQHPYAIRKELTHSLGVRRGIANGTVIGEASDCLILPIRDINKNKLIGVECINHKGFKQTYGKKSGGALVLGNTLQLNRPWFIAEGFASAAACLVWQGAETAICAFGKAALLKVAEEVESTYQPRTIIVLWETDGV